MIKLFEHRVIKEAYDASAPDWIKTWLTKRFRADRWKYHRTNKDDANSNTSSVMGSQFDLGHAEWHEEDVPTSPKDPRLTDPSRVSFFLIPGSTSIYDYDTRKYNTIEKDTILSYDYGASNDPYYRWYPRLSELGFRSNASLKSLLPRFTKYAWVERDSNKQNAEDIQQQREELQKGAIALQRTMNNWWGHKDASGYIVDRSKYKRLLVSKNASKIVQKACDEINEYITNAKTLIKDFVSNGIDNFDGWKSSNKIGSSIQTAMWSLERLLDYAEKCDKWLQKLDNGEELSDTAIYEIADDASNEYTTLVNVLK